MDKYLSKVANVIEKVANYIESIENEDSIKECYKQAEIVKLAAAEKEATDQKRKDVEGPLLEKISNFISDEKIVNAFKGLPIENLEAVNSILEKQAASVKEDWGRVEQSKTAKHGGNLDPLAEFALS